MFSIGNWKLFKDKSPSSLKGADSHEQIKIFFYFWGILHWHNNFTVSTHCFNDIKNPMQNKGLCKVFISAPVSEPRNVGAVTLRHLPNLFTHNTVHYITTLKANFSRVNFIYFLIHCYLVCKVWLCSLYSRQWL